MGHDSGQELESGFGFVVREHRVVYRRAAMSGDRITFVPDYSDTTTFRHDAFVAHRAGVVEEVIPLAGRGRLT